MMKIIYKSNAGIIIETGNKKIAVDLFCDAGELPYTSVSSNLVHAIVNRESPYSKIDYMLYTHRHMDHFCAENVDEYLAAEGGARLIIPYMTSKELTSEFLDRKGNDVTVLKLSRREKLEFETGEVSITAYDFKHEGTESADEENVGYLIEVDGRKILHVGDACIADDNFDYTELEKENIDVLIAPFPYITRRDGLELINKYIKPKKIAVVHLPVEEKDFCGWTRAACKSAQSVREQFEDLVLFTEVDQEMMI